MRIRWHRFNFYLLLTFALAALMACGSMEKKRKKQEAIFRVHIESRVGDGQHTSEVPVYRAHPTMLKIHRLPFVTEENVKSARLVEGIGSFEMQIEFDRSGKHLLEQYTADNRNKHLAIFAEFPCPTNLDLQVNRWLAAPKITQRISDGLLVFTPDANRVEADQIVTGLNNVSKRLKTGEEPKW